MFLSWTQSEAVTTIKRLDKLVLYGCKQSLSSSWLWLKFSGSGTLCKTPSDCLHYILSLPFRLSPGPDSSRLMLQHHLLIMKALCYNCGESVLCPSAAAVLLYACWSCSIDGDTIKYFKTEALGERGKARQCQMQTHASCFQHLL